jgi:hypothetical protein
MTAPLKLRLFLHLGHKKARWKNRVKDFTQWLQQIGHIRTARENLDLTNEFAEDVTAQENL